MVHHLAGPIKLNLSSLLFSKDLASPDCIARQYPRRHLDVAAMVTRIGPSPTGMMHIGTLYVALINSMLAHQSKGRMILRIEDTDKRREVEGASKFIVESLQKFGIEHQEGPTLAGDQKGEYGPYVQSQRRNIYQVCAKSLLDAGKAYPCFATPEQLNAIRDEQTKIGARSGYYGQWAIWRNASPASVSDALGADLPWVLRFRSNGQHSNKVAFTDSIFGHREMAENDHDIVILKSDGLPTYHFAHVVDDHLMGTTDVVRGDEWLASVPTHLQLFEAFGWRAPRYAHIAPINKVEGSSRRKLSKRKDPEASVHFFQEEGYPEEAILEYLLSLVHSGFEDWRSSNVNEPLMSFPLSLEDLQPGGGPVFDFKKLDFICKEIVASMSAEDVFVRGVEWARRFDPEFAKLLVDDPTYTQSALSIERGNEQSRKDIRKWSDLRSEIGFFFDELYQFGPDELLGQLEFLEQQEIDDLARQFLISFDPSDARDVWFAKLKKAAIAHGFAPTPKDFKRCPEKYKGSIAHAAEVFRVLLTGSPTSPDLFSVMQVMGSERVHRRLTVGQSQ